MFLRKKIEFHNFQFHIDFKMAASIGSHFENIKSDIFKKKRPISMQFV